MRRLLAVAAVATLATPGAHVDARVSKLRGLRANVVVASHGSVFLDRGYGPGPGRNAVYDIGSVAKSFTSAAVLQLVQRGRLRLAEPLPRLLPRVPAARRDVTISELLIHTAGIPRYFAPDRERVDYGSAIRRILALPSMAQGRFLYSDAGYTLLAAIVQHVTHEPFEQYVRTNLFAKAGLRHTGFIGDAAVRGSNRAHGYVAGRDRGPAGTQAPLSWSIIGAGGILSTAADLFR